MKLLFGVRVTAAGWQSFQCEAPITGKLLFFQPRGDVPQSEWTEWELIVTLLDKRWKWARMPVRKEAKARLPSHQLTLEEAPGIFYGGKSIPREYLQCLLSQKTLYETQESTPLPST